MTAVAAAVFLFASLQDMDEKALHRVLAFQERIQKLVETVRPAFVFIGDGSGVCISRDGWVLTNHHVAGPTGREWEVRFTGGKAYAARVVGHDPLHDISLLKIDTPDLLPFLELGDSDAMQVGQHVIAVGNPFLLGSGEGSRPVGVGAPAGRTDGNWEPTITFGIISAMHRHQDAYSDAIQTDCQINPGNSGGPLINLQGRIIGINGRIATRTHNRVNTGIGYAIPSNLIRNFMDAYKAGGRVRRGYIDGIVITNCGHEGYEHAGEYGDGVLVVGVSEPSPASKAGLREGDIIVRIAGHRVFNDNRFHGVLSTFPQGATVPVVVRRRHGDGWKEIEVSVWLGDPNKRKPAD